MSAKAVNDFDTETEVAPAVIETPAPMQPQAPTTSNGKPLAVKTLCDGRVMLFNDDCFNVLKHLKAGTVAMVFADLPYGTTANKWDSILPLDALWQQLLRIGNKTTPYVFTANGGFQFALYNSQPKLYKYDWVWEKSKATGHARVQYEPMRAHEYVHIYYEKAGTYNPQKTPGKPYTSPYSKANNNYAVKQEDAYNTGGIRYDNETGDRYPRTILRIKDAYYTDGHHHPTQKPVELLEYLIKTYTNPGDLVLDPTMGSGTTAVACKHLGRRCIGIEMDQTYFNIAVDRVINE